MSSVACRASGTWIRGTNDPTENWAVYTLDTATLYIRFNTSSHRYAPHERVTISMFTAPFKKIWVNGWPVIDGGGWKFRIADQNYYDTNRQKQFEDHTPLGGTRMAPFSPITFTRSVDSGWASMDITMPSTATSKIGNVLRPTQTSTELASTVLCRRPEPSTTYDRLQTIDIVFTGKLDTGNKLMV